MDQTAKRCRLCKGTGKIVVETKVGQKKTKKERCCPACNGLGKSAGFRPK